MDETDVSVIDGVILANGRPWIPERLQERVIDISLTQEWTE